jgi:hypothetical protein
MTHEEATQRARELLARGFVFGVTAIGDTLGDPTEDRVEQLARGLNETDENMKTLTPEELQHGLASEAEYLAQLANAKREMSKADEMYRQLQAFVDSLWAKYGKIKGEDKLMSDGVWAKVEQK